MIVKKNKVLEWDINKSTNDGYLATGSFPLSLGNENEFKQIKKDKIPILFILDKEIGIISRSRDKYPGELNSITNNSKKSHIFNKFSEIGTSIGIRKYIGFSTFYNKFQIIKGKRNNFQIRMGIIIKIFSTNKKQIYIIELNDEKLNEWRNYKTKTVTIQELQELENKKVTEGLNYSEKELLNKIKIKKPLEIYISSTKIYNRNPYVIALSLKRAKGICELGQNKAPFKNKRGQSYLEVHHIIPLSKNGEDDITNVIALCPNCHKELHYGYQKDIIKKKLLKIR